MRNGFEFILLILLIGVILIAGCTSSTETPIVTPVPTDSTALTGVSGDLSTPQPTAGASLDDSYTISIVASGDKSYNYGETVTFSGISTRKVEGQGNVLLVLMGEGIPTDQSVGGYEIASYIPVLADNTWSYQWTVPSSIDGQPIRPGTYTVIAYDASYRIYSGPQGWQWGYVAINLNSNEPLLLTTPQPTPMSSELIQVTPTANSEDTEANKIAQAIDYQNPLVKNFATAQIQKTSTGTLSNGKINIAQVCDVWQTIHNEWTYVADPIDFNYFTPASDTINNGLKGNCVDYATLNAAVIESIGGNARVVTACPPNGGECHAYAEDLLDPSQIKSIANYIGQRYGTNYVYWHTSTDSQGNTQYWLNLDWSANYPGGPFFQDNGIIHIFYPNGFHVTSSG